MQTSAKSSGKWKKFGQRATQGVWSDSEICCTEFADRAIGSDSSQSTLYTYVVSDEIMICQVNHHGPHGETHQESDEME
eukprot:1934403-Amphidinium_carterae.1